MTHFAVLLFSSLPLSALVGVLAQRRWKRTLVAPPNWVVLLITGFTGGLVVFADKIVRQYGLFTPSQWLLTNLFMVAICSLLAYWVMSIVQERFPLGGNACGDEMLEGSTHQDVVESNRWERWRARRLSSLRKKSRRLSSPRCRQR